MLTDLRAAFVAQNIKAGVLMLPCGVSIIPVLALDFFDIVVEYTCFCAIDTNRRSEYVQVVSKILKQKS